MTLAERQSRFKATERAKARVAVRPEAPRERQRRLRLGWDWRNGAASVRHLARSMRG